MASLYLLELTTVVSFLYSVFSIFFSFTSIENMILVFAWTVLVALITSLLSKKCKLFNVLILLNLLPIYFFNTRSTRALMITCLIFIFTYIKASLGKVNYYEHVRKVKIAHSIILMLAILSLTLDDMSGSIGYALPFVTIFILTSILFIRVMRHMDSNLDLATIKGANRKFILISMIGFVLASYERISSSIIRILNKLIDLIYYPLYLLLKNVRVEGGLERQVEEEFIQGALEDIPELLDLGDMGIQEFTEKSADILVALAKVLRALSVIAFILIIYYILSRRDKTSSIIRDYTEEREYIKTRKKRKRLFRERFPKTFREQIRYYYRRYLERLKKDKVEILSGDTSLDINSKAGEAYQGNIVRMREIYIETRYGSGEASESKVKEMERLYKDL